MTLLIISPECPIHCPVRHCLTPLDLSLEDSPNFSPWPL